MQSQYSKFLLLLLLSVVGVPLAAAAKTPTFFFAGQSNMEGFTHDGLDLTETLNRLMNNDSTLLSYLKGAESSPETPAEAYALEAAQLIALRDRGIITADFSAPLSSVRCSFHRLVNEIDYRNSDAEKPEVLADNVELKPTAGCGVGFGPELGFGHILDDFYDEQFSVFKLASGGSTLKNNWSKKDGGFWPVVKDRIGALNTEKEEWKGIVWFQGENDTFDAFEQNSVENYFADLTEFIKNLRNEMYATDAGTFQSSEDIPVVIVQVGCWIRTLDDAGANISKAQSDFVSAQEKYYASVGKSSKTSLVFTGDLSCHYHFDDVSQIIIGTRVADAMRPLLRPSQVGTPTDPITTPAPTPLRATPSPTNSPVMTSTPKAVPTPAPATQSPTNTPVMTSTPAVTPVVNNDNQGDLYVNLVIKLDEFPEETAWSLEETNSRTKLHWVDPAVYANKQQETVTQKLWLDPIDMTYTFIMTDTWGDGIRDGYFELTRSNGDLIARVDDFGDFNKPITFSMTSMGINPSAVMAPPAAAPSMPIPTETDSFLTPFIQLDDYPEEISWTIVETDTQKAIHWVEPDAYGNQVHKIIIKTLWLKPNVSYDFIMKDTFGDGLISGGYCVLSSGTGQTLARVDDFSSSERVVRFQMTN